MRTVAYTPNAVSMRYRRVNFPAREPGYSRAMDPPGNRLATPDIVIVPAVSQVLAGTDPVPDRALSYRVPS